MSKKTRKKSSKASSGKVSRTRPKPPAQKAVRTTGLKSAPKSAKSSAKATAKTTAETSAKTPAKTTARKSTRDSAKTPLKAPKATSKKQGGVRAKRSAPEIMVTPDRAAATTATKTPAAPVHNAAPAAAAPRNTAATEAGQAPNFQLPRDGGERVSLADYLGRKLVIFFYPRADTAGCTREAIDFTRLKDDFAQIRTEVLGVSADPVKTQESFRNKHQLSIPLASDETHEMLQAYGAWGEKSMYGRSFHGVLRTTVLIDADGRIAKIWRGVKVDGHADEVLAAAREL